jgi:hypothetical protein
VTSDALARAKLDAACACEFRTFVYLLLLLPVSIIATRKVDALQRLSELSLVELPAWRLAPLAAMALAGLVGMTWLHVVAGTFSSICGRAWLLNGTALVYVAITAAAGGFVHSIVVRYSEWFVLEHIRPTIIGLAGPGCCLLVLKLGALAAILKLQWHERTAPILFSWLAIAACWIVPLYAAVPANPIPHSLVVLYVLLALPLNRPLLLPAAIAWNRHR